MSTIHGSRRRPLPAAALAIAATTLAALAGASSADAAVTCSYDAGFNVVSVEFSQAGDVAAVRVNGNLIEVIPGVVGSAPCLGAGGPPRVSNTDVVVVTDNSNDPLTPEAADGSTGIQIDDPAGFAPGANEEGGDPASSEIEFQVRLGAGLDGLALNSAGERDDSINIGTGGINWNATAETALDADLTHSGVELMSFSVDGGNNVVTAQGGLGTGDAFAGPARLLMSGQLGADTFVGSSGDDVLAGGGGDDTLLGGPGDDFLEAGEGDDTLGGSAGDDRMLVGPGDDTIAGGDGAHDVAEFRDAPGPVIVDLNLTGPQDTGIGTDVLTGVEDLTGSEGPDTLIGDAGVNVLLGLDGDDTLDGGPGDDLLDGANDVDTVTYAHASAAVTANLGSGAFGGGGNDTLVLVERLVGSPFADDLTGDDGSNVITGLGGVDTIRALGGADAVNARDSGPDTVSCGSEDDSVLADRRGVDASIDGDCEIVDFLPEPVIADPPPGGVPPGGGGALDTAISVVLRSARSQRVLRQKGVIVRVICPQEDCTARASGGSSKLRLTPLTRSIRGGAGRTLKLRLARRHRRAIRSALVAGRRPKLRVTVRVTDAAGNAARRSVTVRVKS
jgi:Ca2+-binding RTX toxin-like protein